MDSWEGVPPDLERLRLPPLRYAVFEHDVSRDRMHTWVAVHGWLSQGEHEAAGHPSFERFRDPRSALGDLDRMELWVPVMRRLRRRW